MTFKAGQSGNPAGRPTGVVSLPVQMRKALSSYGSRHGITDASQELLDKIIGQALDGDSTAQKLIIDRLHPMPKPRATPVDVPNGDSTDGLVEQATNIIQAVFEGRLTPEEGRGLVGTLHDVVRIQESTELAERIGVLEQQLEERR